MKPRTNARGELHCRMCDRYLPTDHFRIRTDRCNGYKSYCNECQRAYWREHKKMRPSARSNRERANEVRKGKREARVRDKARFAANAIVLLRGRGYTYAEIERQFGIKRQTASNIARGKQKIVYRQTVNRLSDALITTAGRV